MRPPLPDPSHLARRAIAIAALVALPSIAAAQTMSLDAASGTWALTNARIETITKGTIDRGTVVIRDGVIEAVGASITPPADARVVDLSGKTIYPGFFDMTSTLGLPAEVVAGRGGRGGGRGAEPAADTTTPRFIGLEPNRVIANEIRPGQTDVRAWRDVGVTTALVAPARGLFRGLSALVPLRDDTAKRWVVRSPVAEHIGYQGVGNEYPETLLGVIAVQRQSFYDAKRHSMIMDRYKSNPKGMPRASYDADLDALVPVLKGDLPAFVAASEENEIRRAMALGKEFGFKPVIVGAMEGFEATDALKDARAVVVSVNFPEPTAVTGWAYFGARREEFTDTVGRTAAVRAKLEGNAATLSKAGIKFAFGSGGSNPATFMANVRKAIAAGLPKQTALEALTIRAAEVAGVDQQLGSVEAGKIANLLVYDGEALTDGSKLRQVFVDGQRYEVLPMPPAGRGNRAGGAGANPPEEKR